MMELILASGSPRRKQLLEEAGYTFNTEPIKVSEIIKENLSWDEVLKDLARQKGVHYVSEHNTLKTQSILVLSADTLVVFDGKALGKPKDPDQAVEFLTALSGQKHCVMTGICLIDMSQNKTVTEVESTEIEFTKLSKQQIVDYVNTGEPMGKAGAYAIQGAGGEFVKKITGSYTNVVGLPMELFEKTLQQNGWTIGKR